MKVISFILISLGVMLTIIGAAFKILHWPDLFLGIVSGPMLLLAGILLMVFRKKKIT